MIKSWRRGVTLEKWLLKGGKLLSMKPSQYQQGKPQYLKCIITGSAIEATREREELGTLMKDSAHLMKDLVLEHCMPETQTKKVFPQETTFVNLALSLMLPKFPPRFLFALMLGCCIARRNTNPP